MWSLLKLRRYRLRAVLRMLAFFAAVSGVSVVLLLGSARAQVEKRTRDMGQKLLAQLGPLVLEEPSTVTVNGQQMFMASTLTPLPADQVLARFEAHCQENSGGLEQAFGKLPSHFRGKEIPDQMRDPARWLTHRSGTAQGDLGEITCFTRRDSSSAAGFMDRWMRFAETGDVSEFGNMRYVVARRVTPKTTQVLAIWTEGSFKVPDMFPEHGDAPGSDSRNAPRPPESVRLLSAEFRGQPYSARIYESRRAPAAVLAFYDGQMRERNFIAEPVWKEHASDRRVTDAPSYARAFTKAGATIIVSALTDPVFGDGTQVAIAEIGTRGVIHAVAGASSP
ncbi:MAG TPA: hypothetical protein VK524_28385 [Polyangiaceae bacterium]|nr:hypothetical protein [Polyangiaceae bacterium]